VEHVSSSLTARTSDQMVQVYGARLRRTADSALQHAYCVDTEARAFGQFLLGQVGRQAAPLKEGATDVSVGWD
jgi:hypothetical protein